MNIIAKITVGLLCLIFMQNKSIASKPADDPMPADHREINKPVNYEQMKGFLEKLAGQEFISIETIGKTVAGRDLFVVKLDHKKSQDPWRVLFYAQQHGNEPAGKEALLYLIRQIAQKPDLLPDDVSLWIIPTVNPDGAEADQRRNKNGADLNRDHQTLAQPEIRALYTTFRLFMPHVSVDCHEFARDSEDFSGKGWLEWPLIMMDTANNPLFHPDIVSAGVRWVNQVAPYMEQKGHNYTRYHVGGVPPDEEQRFSSPEVDDGRNGLGAYGGLSFIIESGVQRSVKEGEDDLGLRVDAYLDLLTRFIYDDSHRAEDMKIVAQARSGSLPDFIPTNYFWGSLGQKITPVKVIDKQSAETRFIQTANFMTDMIIKKNVTTPAAYAIGAEQAEPFIRLLKDHDLKYEILASEKKYLAQGVELIEYADKEDEVYNRYAGRQVVKPQAPKEKAFGKGSIIVKLDQLNSIRTILLLEPNMMYGIYNSQDYRKLVDENNILPVWRILE